MMIEAQKQIKEKAMENELKGKRIQFQGVGPGNKKLYGVVVGSAIYDDEDVFAHRRDRHAYIVKLDTPLWTEGRETYIRLIAVHPDNITLEETINGGQK